MIILLATLLWVLILIRREWMMKALAISCGAALCLMGDSVSAPFIVLGTFPLAVTAIALTRAIQTKPAARAARTRRLS